MPARIKAFLIHFILSLVIALASLLWVFIVWYPAPLHMALGVTYIFTLLVVVDMILGPALTLVVYRKSKKNLALDLLVIAFIQLSALSYGFWTMAEGRPAWLVFNVDRFDVVQVIDIDRRDLDLAISMYRTPSMLGPQWVGADHLESIKNNDIILESIFGGPDIAQRPYLYRPLNELIESISSAAQPLNKLQMFNDEETVTKILNKWPQASGWIPLMARKQPMSVLLTKDNTEILAVVPLKPWGQ